MIAPDHAPFKLPIPHQSGGFRKALFSVVGGALEKMLSLDQLNQAYLTLARRDDKHYFGDRILDYLRISYEVSSRDAERIPTHGKVVIVANHPFGGLEGIILASLLKSIRPDVKLMANFLLERIPHLRDNFIFVDPFNRGGSAKINMRPLKESIQWLEHGGALGIFPAGAVSHVHLKRGEITDPPWSPSIARLIKRTESPVVPVYFHGSNGMMFQMLGMMHPRLRTAMLPRELLNKQDRVIHVRIGKPILPEKMAEFDDDTALADFLRLRTYHLQNRIDDEKPGKLISLPIRFAQPRQATIAPAIHPDQLAQDIANLPEDHLLAESGELQAWYAKSSRLPNIIQEIGRLREATFRAVGEGTGHSVDLDRFDDFYIHLFIWHTGKREIVGAYRLGQADLILDQFGKRGLYTSTLFKIKKKLLRQLGPSLEMGRSFVRQEYQKSFMPLLMLWKGIGQYVARHPRYRYLFGPVSITENYKLSTRQMLAAALKDSLAPSEHASLVKARKPLRMGTVQLRRMKELQKIIRGIEDLDELVSEVEDSMTGMPILLRQYLRLGGKLLAFNIDKAFGNCLDGLILVDLVKADPRVLEKYFGKEGLRAFLHHHKATS